MFVDASFAPVDLRNVGAKQCPEQRQDEQEHEKVEGSRQVLKEMANLAMQSHNEFLNKKCAPAPWRMIRVFMKHQCKQRCQVGDYQQGMLCEAPSDT